MKDYIIPLAFSVGFVLFAALVGHTGQVLGLTRRPPGKD